MQISIYLFIRISVYLSDAEGAAEVLVCIDLIA